MNYKAVLLTIFSLISCTGYAMQFQEDPQLRAAILRLDSEEVYNILNQREDYFSEEEYMHYTGILNQVSGGNYYQPDMENWAYFQNIYGPLSGSVFALYGLMGDAIISRWKVAHPSTIIEWAKYGIWKTIHLSSRTSLAIGGSILACWLGSYIVIPYLETRGNRHPGVASELNRFRAAIYQAPVYPDTVLITNRRAIRERHNKISQD